MRLHDQGLIYRGNYLVNWSPQLQTAVSDLEVREGCQILLLKIRLFSLRCMLSQTLQNSVETHEPLLYCSACTSALLLSDFVQQANHW